MIDTVGFVRALLNPFGPWGQILFELAPRYRLIMSDLLADEIDEIFERPVLAHRYSMLPGRNIDAIRSLFEAAEWVELTAVPRASRDPGDDHVAATASTGKADFLVTEDKDLLDLVEHDGVRIIDGNALLKIIRQAPEQIT